MRRGLPLLLVLLVWGCAEPTEVIGVLHGEGGGGAAGGEGGEGGHGGQPEVIELSPPETLDVGCGEAGDVVGGDVDGDGVTDLLVAGECVQTLRGTGDGFEPPQTAVAGFGDAVVAGFLDSSPPLDVVAYGDEAQVFGGDGLGGFHLLHHLAAPGPGLPGTLSLAQLLGDAAIDLVTVSGQHLQLWENDGEAGFAPALALTAGADVVTHAAGDLDGDGHPDVIGAAAGVVRWMAQGAGFSDPEAVAVSRPESVRTVLLAHLDGDSCLDAIAADGSSGVTAPSDGAVRVLLNACDGSGALAEHIAIALPFATVLHAADLSGDGAVEIIAGRGGAEPALVVLRGHGDGSFAPPRVFVLPSAPRALAVLHADGDQRLDVAVAAGATVLVLRNGG
jgi:hypothetical protein